jgi:hypothetical protein
MGANVIYKLLLRPLYQVFGKQINAAIKRTSEQLKDYDTLV